MAKSATERQHLFPSEFTYDSIKFDEGFPFQRMDDFHFLEEDLPAWRSRCETFH